MQFTAKSQFPDVIEAIDCALIAKMVASENKSASVNLKHFHSINVQVLCDAQICLTNLGLAP